MSDLEFNRANLLEKQVIAREQTIAALKAKVSQLQYDNENMCNTIAALEQEREQWKAGVEKLALRNQTFVEALKQVKNLAIEGNMIEAICIKALQQAEVRK